MIHQAIPLAKSRSKADLERSALEALDHFCPNCLQTPSAVPVEEILEYKLFETYSIPFEAANLPFNMEAVTHPRTEHSEPAVQMQHWMYDRLLRGDGRARFTAAHELGHAILHVDEVEVDMVAGEPLDVGKTRFIPWDRNPERQANIFAAHFLMPTCMVRVVASRRCATSDTVAGVFCISESAASYRLKELGLC